MAEKQKEAGGPPAEPPDAEQLALDLEDARLRLREVRNAISNRESMAETVAKLKRELAQAKRRLKEAEWKVATVIARTARE